MAKLKYADAKIIAIKKKTSKNQNQNYKLKRNLSSVEWQKEEKCCNEVESPAEHGPAADEGAACLWGILTYSLARHLDIAAALDLSHRERPFYWLLPSSCDAG